MRYTAAFIFCAACFAPPPETSAPPGSGPDAGATATPDAPANACSQAAPPPGSGNHNAGLNCLGCHTGAGAPRWTAAGTAYSSGGAPAVGATITLVDATGRQIAIVTAQNGNFWTTESLAMPLRVKASRCPTSLSMPSAANGACNTCHTQGGTAGRLVIP